VEQSRAGASDVTQFHRGAAGALLIFGPGSFNKMRHPKPPPRKLAHPICPIQGALAKSTR
jgi:hypothetical protein